ncbi:hypothetical protein Tco_1026756 [Tanacetum coccineum]
MMTARKRVGPLPTHCLAVRHSVDYSSSDHFTSDDSSRDSSSETSSDSSSSHSSSDHSSPTLPSGMRSSHQLCSSVPSIPHSSAAITERPSNSSFAGPFRKRSSSNSLSDLEDCSNESSESSVLRETSLRDDVDVEGSDEPYSGPDIDLEEVETSARGTVKVSDDRVTHLVVSDDIPEPAQEEGVVEVTYEMLGDLVQRFHDHTMEIPVHRVKVIESIQRD